MSCTWSSTNLKPQSEWLLLDIGLGYLTPAPHATRGVSVFEGCPSPWLPMIRNYIKQKNYKTIIAHFTSKEQLNNNNIGKPAKETQVLGN